MFVFHWFMDDFGQILLVSMPIETTHKSAKWEILNDWKSEMIKNKYILYQLATLVINLMKLGLCWPHILFLEQNVSIFI